MTAAGWAAPHAILVLTSGLLLYVAAIDLRDFRIRNEMVLALAGLFLLHAIVSGRWIDLHWNVAFAAAAFLLMLLCYLRGLMGGGDLKLMAVALLWSGPHCALAFLLILSCAAALHAVAARLGWVGAQHVNGRLKVAFAPSIVAGLLGIFLLDCLSPV